MTTRFSPSVLQDYDALKKFFSGTEAIDDLKRKAAKSELPFEWDESLMPIYSAFAKALSEVFLTFSLWDLGHKWLLQAKWAQIHPDSYFRKLFGDRFLVRSVNLPPLDKVDECSQCSMEVASLDDSRVKKLLPANVKQLQFIGEEGGCLGGSEWMLSLYFRTTNLFANTKQHLIALANLFRKGLPLEAQVLQAFDNDGLLESPHLGLSKRLYAQIGNTGSFEQRLEKAAATLLSAPAGAYAVSLPGHRVTWFKVDSTTSYLHCENMGLIEILTVQDYIQACNILLTTYRNALDPNAMTIRSVKKLTKGD